MRCSAGWDGGWGVPQAQPRLPANERGRFEAPPYRVSVTMQRRCMVEGSLPAVYPSTINFCSMVPQSFARREELG